MRYLIYAAIRKDTGKAYVGLTAKSIVSRWKSHCRHARQGSEYPIHCAIREHGSDAFQVRLLDAFDDREEALEAEKEWIQTLDAYSSGYNATRGGDKGPVMVGEENPLVKINDETAYKAVEAIQLYEVPASHIAEELGCDKSIICDWARGTRRSYLYEKFVDEHPEYADNWTRLDDRRAEAVAKAISTTRPRSSVAKEYGFGRWNFYNICSGDRRPKVRETVLQRGIRDCGSFLGKKGSKNPSSALCKKEVLEIRSRWTGEGGRQQL